MATTPKGGLGKRPTATTSRLIPTGETDPAPTAAEALTALTEQPAQTKVASKADYIKKCLTLSPELNERLRRFCFEKKSKDIHVFRSAIDEFLSRNGY